ncbi:MAG: ribosomal protein L7/L12, partial [Paludibacteraceae bacterium]|nr:ribosomal protein L7/L12 [Paludibacteraceae bacterium]
EEEDEDEEDADISGDCTVRLVETGPQKLMLVKTINEWLKCGLKEAKDFVDSAPVDLISDINDEAAEAFAEALREIGATIEITK